MTWRSVSVIAAGFRPVLEPCNGVLIRVEIPYCDAPVRCNVLYEMVRLELRFTQDGERHRARKVRSKLEERDGCRLDRLVSDIDKHTANARVLGQPLNVHEGTPPILHRGGRIKLDTDQLPVCIKPHLLWHDISPLTPGGGLNQTGDRVR